VAGAGNKHLLGNVTRVTLLLGSKKACVWLRAENGYLIKSFFEPIVLFERHCHVTKKSEAIACARICRSSRLSW
jgi:hypothetical protein